MEYLDYIAEHEKFLGRLVPCSKQDVATLERRIGHSLPGAYIEYLLLAGKEAHKLFSGTEHQFGILLTLQRASRELLEQDEFCKQLTDLDFVFLFHQGYEFHFFRLDEGDDPPVYYYLEQSEDEDFEKVADSFSAFMKETVDQVMWYMNRSQSRRES